MFPKKIGTRPFRFLFLLVVYYVYVYNTHFEKADQETQEPQSSFRRAADDEQLAQYDQNYLFR